MPLPARAALTALATTPTLAERERFDPGDSRQRQHAVQVGKQVTATGRLPSQACSQRIGWTSPELQRGQTWSPALVFSWVLPAFILRHHRPPQRRLDP